MLLGLNLGLIYGNIFEKQIYEKLRVGKDEVVRVKIATDRMHTGMIADSSIQNCSMFRILVS